MTDQPLRLARYFEVFIEEQIARRKFSDATEVIEEALRLLERRESENEWIRRALIEGEQSGPSAPYDFEEIIRTARAGAGLPTGGAA